jgi:hypothetical protein
MCSIDATNHSFFVFGELFRQEIFLWVNWEEILIGSSLRGPTYEGPLELDLEPSLSMEGEEGPKGRRSTNRPGHCAKHWESGDRVASGHPVVLGSENGIKELKTPRKKTTSLALTNFNGLQI